MNEAQAIIKAINTIFGITYRDGYYWTGLYYRGNKDSQIGSKTYRGILSTIFWGRY